MRLTLELPYPTPSLNDWAGKVSRWRYAKDKQIWVRRIRDAWYETRLGNIHHRPWPDKPGPVVLHVERFTPTENALDVDNLVGGLKPVIDALRVVGLIEDDKARGPSALSIAVSQPVNPYRVPIRWTRLTLEQVDA